MTRHVRGFTIIELMVVIAVVAILASLAAPSYQKLIERNRLKEATQSFKSDVQLARMEAIKRNRDILLRRKSGDDGTWCYGISTVVCDCEQPDDTEADFCDVKRIAGSSFPVVSLVASGDTFFDFRRGTSTDLGSVFTTRQFAAQVSVSKAGRVEICDPDPVQVDANGKPLGGIYGACGE